MTREAMLAALKDAGLNVEHFSAMPDETLEELIHLLADRARVAREGEDGDDGSGDDAAEMGEDDLDPHPGKATRETFDARRRVAGAFCERFGEQFRSKAPASTMSRADLERSAMMSPAVARDMLRTLKSHKR